MSYQKKGQTATFCDEKHIFRLRTFHKITEQIAFILLNLHHIMPDYDILNYLKNKACISFYLNDEDKTKYLGDIRKSVEEAVKIMQFAHIPSRKYHPYTQYILDNYSELIK